MKFIKTFGTKNLIIMVLLLSILVFGIFSLNNISSSKEEEMTKNIEAAILSAAIQCYALEGSYPPDIVYLVQNYGLIVDERIYFVFYDIQGSNMMPNVAVYKR